MTTSLKNILLFLLIALFACNTFAQTKEEIAIQTLLDNAEKHYYDHNKNTKAFDYAQKALALAKQHDLKNQMAKSYSLLSGISYELGLHDEALVYIGKGKTVCPPNDKETMGQLQLLEAGIFYAMGLDIQALNQSYETVAMLLPYSEKKEEGVVLRNTYELINVIYLIKKEYDSVDKYSLKVKELLFKLPESEMYSTLSDFYGKEAFQVYRKNADLDAALTLFNKGFELRKRYNNTNLLLEYHSLGRFYEDIDKDKSLEYYLKAIANAKTERIDASIFYKLYFSISKLYGEKGDLVNEKKYLSLYTEKNQEVIAQQKKNTEYIFNAIVEENKNEQQKQRIYQNRLFLIGGCIVLIALGVFFIVKRKHKHQQKQLTEKLYEKDEVVEVLSKKVNDYFEELIELGKKNDPQFWIRFQEVYPDYLKKMMALNDKLTVGELTITAYHYLGFTTKDIATYTFKTMRTIEGTRYRLRKKLEIATDENFILWIRQYIDNT